MRGRNSITTKASLPAHTWCWSCSFSIAFSFSARRFSSASAPPSPFSSRRCFSCFSSDSCVFVFSFTALARIRSNVSWCCARISSSRMMLRTMSMVKRLKESSPPNTEVRSVGLRELPVIKHHDKAWSACTSIDPPPPFSISAPSDKPLDAQFHKLLQWPSVYYKASPPRSGIETCFPCGVFFYIESYPSLEN